jgi:hypothetical protein
MCRTFREIGPILKGCKKVTNGVADHAGNTPVTGTEAGATVEETSGGAGVPADHETTSQCHLHESAFV